MMDLHSGRFALRLRIAMMRAGVLPCLSAALCIVAVATWAGVAVLAREAAMLEPAKVTSAPAPPVALGSAVHDMAGTVPIDRNLDAFREVLGNAEDVEAHVRRLFAIAANSGIELEQGEYKWEADKGGAIARYQIQLPIKGSYGAIRRFCERALLALPFASLDELSFKRESIGDDALEAAVRLTLFLADNARAAPAAAGTRP